MFGLSCEVDGILVAVQGPPADPEGTRNWTLFFVGVFVLSIALNLFIGFNP
jgi:hypothetical protein